MPEAVVSLYSDILRFATAGKFPEADAVAVHFRSGLDTVRLELEQAAIEGPDSPVVFEGGGRLSTFLSDPDRSRRLAGSARALYVFGASEAEPAPAPRVTAIRIPPPSLARDYFCIVSGEGWQAGLIAGEILERIEDDRLKRYNAFVSFDRKLIARAMQPLIMMLGSRGIPVATAPAPPEGPEAEAYRQIRQTLIVNRLAVRLSTLSRQLQQRTLVDPLTGLHNQEHFHATLLRESSRFNRLQQPFSVIFLDIRGPEAEGPTGSLVVLEEPIRRLADLLRRTLRKGIDSCFKLRDNEFAVILDGTRDQQAARVALRVQKEFEGLKLPGVELKVGVSEFATGKAVASLLDYARRRLDEAR